jgi:hypothetical protein
VFETVILQAVARANVPTYYRCIGICWLRESSRHHRFPKVGRPWHHWQITVNAASSNQSAANAIANILLSHRQNLVQLIYELLKKKSRCGLYTLKYGIKCDCVKVTVWSLTEWNNVLSVYDTILPHPISTVCHSSTCDLRYLRCFYKCHKTAPYLISYSPCTVK